MTSIASFEPNNDVKSPRSFIPNQISVRRSRRGHTLFSSFRQKSFCAPSSDAIAPLGSPSRQWSIGTTPPDPPRIRTLIQRSGIWNEIQDSNNTTNQTMHAIMEDEQGGNEPSAAAMMEGRMITRRVSIALQSTMDELLLLDGLGPLHRISNNNNSAEESQSSSSRVNGASNRHHSRTAATTKISFQSSSEGASSRDPHSTEGTVSEVSLPSGLESDASLRDAHASSEPCTSATQQPPPHSSPPTTTTKNERGKEPITDSGKSPPEISRRDCLPPRALPEALDKPPPRHPSFPPGPPPPRPSSKFLPKTSLQTPPTLKKRFASSENSSQQFIGGMDQLNDDSQPSEHSSSSIVSDLTFASSSRRSLCTSLMVIDPRAPQLQMALEQQDLSRRRRRTTTTSAATTTRGLEQQNAATSIESSACSSTLNPPMRKRSLAPDQPPPLRKTSPITEEKMSRSSGCSSDRERILEEDEIPRSNFDREPSMDPVLPYARRNTSSSTVLLKNRRLSSVRGEEHSEIENSDDEEEEEEEEASIQSILIGPFSSPQHSISSPRTRLPSTSIRLDDSNPQLYPQNLDALPELKNGKNSKNTSRSSSVDSKKPDPMPASLHGPFVSPSLVDTARPNLHNLLVPRKDSNPLLYPANLLSSGDDDDDDGDGDELQRSHGNSTLSPGGMTYIPPSPLPTGKSYVPPSPLQRNGNKRTPSKWKPDEDDDSAVLLESPKVAKTNKNKKTSQQQQQKYADIVLDHGLFSDENNHSKDIISFDPSPTTSTKKTAANKDIIFDGSSVGSSTTSEVVVASSSSSPTASISMKIQSRVITDHGMGETFWSRSSGGSGSGSNCNTGLRVKMCPAQLGYVMKGGEIRIHPGYYSGPLNTKFQMHGNGIFWFDSGDVYLGEFRNGELDGIGAMSIAAAGSTTSSTATANMDDGSSTTKKQVFTGYFQHNEFLGEDLAEDDEIED